MEAIINKFSLEWMDSNNIQSGFRHVGYKLGDKIFFKDDLLIEPYVGFHNSHYLCKIGFQSYTSSQVPLNLEIGRYSSLSWSIDFPHFSHPINAISTSPFTHDLSKQEVSRVIRDYSHSNTINNIAPNPQKGPVIVGNDCWIGQHSVLMAGISIGHGSIIAAHSVVTKSVEPYSIVGGNPAKLIRRRFPEELISALLELEWWNYNFIDFNHLNISDIESFILNFSNLKSNLEIFIPTKLSISEMPKD